MLSQLVKIKDKVEYLLTRNPIFRDSDSKLIARIWASEIKTGTDLNTFLRDFGNGKHTSAEAIRRARQKLQEKQPHLRGKLYTTRHVVGAVVKHQINNIP